MRDRQAEQAILQVARRTLELGPLVRDLSEWILKHNTVVKLFAIHAQCHIDKTLDDWKAMTNLAKTVTESSDCLKDVAKP